MESFVSIIYAVCGLFYTLLAGKGKYLCFIFGLISSILYSFLSFKNAIWGSFLLNFIYYIPIQIISLIKWFKNTNPETKSVEKLKLEKHKFFLYILIAIILSLILSYILYLKQDKMPVFDGFITIFSILGALFTLKRLIEQWIIWIIVNLLTMTMWIILNNYSISFLWLIYFILGIIFYFQWRKEINSNQQ